MRLPLGADAVERGGGADVEALVADGRDGIHRGVELAGGELFELRSGLDDDEIALLAGAEDFAIGGHRAAEELRAALGALDALLVDDLAGLELDAAQDAAVAEEIHVLADDERRGDVGQAFGDVEVHRRGLAALQIERGDLLHAAAGAEGAEVELVAEHAGAEAALAVAGIVLPVELAGFEVEAHDAAGGVGADDFLFAASSTHARRAWRRC
jgi:hypothetical protein